METLPPEQAGSHLEKKLSGMAPLLQKINHMQLHNLSASIAVSCQPHNVPASRKRVPATEQTSKDVTGSRLCLHITLHSYSIVPSKIAKATPTEVFHACVVQRATPSASLAAEIIIIIIIIIHQRRNGRVQAKMATTTSNRSKVKDSEKQSSFFEACKNGDLEKVKKLLTPENVNSRDVAGRKSTPLHFAAGMSKNNECCLCVSACVASSSYR